MVSKIPHYDVRPYYDDFDEAKRFLRVLFRPGIPVQARELTQLQTILQNQFGKIGESLYANGAMVIPGDVKINTEYQFLKVSQYFDEFDALQPIGAIDFEEFLEAKLTSSTLNLSGSLRQVVAAVGQDPLTFYVNYDSTGKVGTGINTQNVKTFQAGERVTIAGFGDVLVDGVGAGLSVNLKEGVYFYNGLLVPVESQTLILSKYTNDYTGITYSVGLQYNEKFITEFDDSALLDNAAGSKNYSAPGAHRLRIDADLKLSSTLADLSNFIEIVRLEDGQIAKKADVPEFAGLQQTLARRTYDESGDYVVNDFLLDIREHLDDDTNRGVFESVQGGLENKMVYELDPGKAYVRGFEIEKLAKTRIVVDKARSTELEVGAFAFADIGGYVTITPVTGLPSLSDGSTTVTLKNGGVGGTDVGTAKVRTVTSGTPAKLYLFDVSFSGLYGWDDVDYVIQLSTAFEAVVTSSLIDAPKARNLFKISQDTIQSVDRLSVDITIAFAGDNHTDSTLDFSLNPADYIVYATGPTYVGPAVSLIPGVNSITVGAGASTVQKVIARAKKTYPTGVPFYKTKTLSSQTDTITTPVLLGTTKLPLNKGDGLSLSRVWYISALSGNPEVDLTDKFAFNNGVTDTYYGASSISGVSQTVYTIINDAVTQTGILNNELFVEYTFWAHSGSGIAFSANSYTASEIKTAVPYVAADGVSYSATNSLDFRPLVSGGTFSGQYAFVHPNTELDTDYFFYVGRFDKISLGSDGVLTVLRGSPAKAPVQPEDSDNAITLYTIFVPPFVFNLSDVISEKKEYRRYTMADIGRIDGRVRNLEYYTSLNLLETKTETLDIGDRFKSGFIVDSFSGHKTGDPSQPDYEIAMDIEAGLARPAASTRAIDIDHNTSLGTTNISKSGDGIITLGYTEKVLVSQPLASSLTRVNPFAIFSWLGSLKLSPNADSWVSTARLPNITVNREGVFDSLAFSNAVNTTGLGTIWNSWSTLWAGSPTKTTSSSVVGRVLSPLHSVRDNFNWGWFGVLRQTVSDVVATKTEVSREIGQVRSGVNVQPFLRDQIDLQGDRVVATAVIPFIREKTIEWSVARMKPNTRLFVYFDGKRIDGDYTSPAVITTNAVGRASGTLTVPNNDKIRFPTGSRIVTFSSDSLDELAGETFARANYTAQGILQTYQATYISTRVRDVVSIPVSQSRVINEQLSSSITTSTRIVGWQDPLAQSFLTDLPGGVFISSVDLFFGPEVVDVKEPVTVQIRTMVNGYPGPDILPFGEVIVEPNFLAGSENASLPTNFKFGSLVHIQENVEYCFVVMANSDILSCWTARMGERDVVTGAQIAKQPYAGVLFKSQNNSTWTADQTADLKFVVNRAKFDVSTPASIYFRNNVLANNLNTESNPYRSRLFKDPFETFHGQTYIRVTQPNHDFAVGDKVRLSHIDPAPPFVENNGIQLAELIGSSVLWFTVITPPGSYEMDNDSYFIDLGTAAVGSGSIGGVGFLATNNISMSTGYLMTSTVIPPGCVVDWGLKGVMRSINSLIPTDVTETVFSKITPNVNLDLGVSLISKLVPDVATDNLNQDLNILIAFSSPVDNLSPFIDLERITMIATENRVVDKDLAGDYSDKKGYVTKKITLVNPANQIRTFLDVLKPSATGVHLYYKTGAAADDFSELAWTALSVDGIEPGSTDIPEDYKEYKFLASAASFTAFQLKIVLHSETRYKVPLIKNLRGIAAFE